nr:hypothetical protein [Plesiomonas shigelloides]
MEMFAWSVNDEDYNSGMFSSFDDAVADALENAEDDDGNKVEFVFIGRVSGYSNSYFFPSGDDIVNHMANAADDVCGEYADNYPDAYKEDISELTERLHKLLEGWCDENKISPTFYTVKSSETVKIR